MPRIAASPTRTFLMVQNNSGVDVRFRLFGEVSTSDPTKSGIKLAADGGFVAVSGAEAALPFYAVHSASGETINLDYEAN